MKHLSEYIRQLQAHGEICFTSDRAVESLSISRAALNISLSRGRERGDIATIAKGFHVIVSPEYQILGSLPANYFIDFLMAYWQINYYVCLLSAAECYGAAHQKPQVYQVMVSKRIRPIRCGKVAVDFIYKKEFAKSQVRKFEGLAGYYNVSSPELTAMDLLLYPDRVGGINRISTILEELVDSLKSERLLVLAQSTKQLNWLQRLGFILEQLEVLNGEKKQTEIIRDLKKYLKRKSSRYIPLAQGAITNKPKNKDWHVIVNAKIEGDL